MGVAATSMPGMESVNRWLMFPADLVGSAAEHLPLWRSYVRSGEDPAIRSIVVSISTNVLINVLTRLQHFACSVCLAFSTRECVAALWACCAPRHTCHYAQNMTENNYILLLTLAGLPCNTNG